MFSLLIKKYIRIVFKRFIYPARLHIYLYLHPKSVILNASIDPFQKNWGDNVSDILINFINPSIELFVNGSIRYLNKYNYVCIGSILNWLVNEKSIIWGAGVINPLLPIKCKPLKVLAVRGPLTREYLTKYNVDCPEIYGDPALLFSKFYTPTIPKKYKLGIILHFKDKSCHFFDSLKKEPSVLFIDVEKSRPWNLFIDGILSCEYVVSSSLHGLIIADSYMIPNIWISFKKLPDEEKFKYDDYFLSVGKDVEPYVIDQNIEIEQLSEKVSGWQKPVINLDRLMNVCPFVNHDNQK